MLKYFSFLIFSLLILLTRPDGMLIWINPKDITSIYATPSGLSNGGTTIRTGGDSYYVKESPQEIMKKMKGK